MPDTFADLNEAAIRADEKLVTAHAAVSAILAGQVPALDTPLQRDCAQAAEQVLSQSLRQARLARLRARARH